MLETALTLLCAHFLADFPLQPDWLLERKNKIWVLIAHILIVTAMAALFLGAIHLPILAIIAVTHLIADYIKVNHCEDTLETFLFDQTIHIVVILAAAVLFPAAFAGGVWPAMPAPATAFYLTGLTLLTGVIVSVTTGGILIAKILAPLSEQLNSTDESDATGGLVNGGKYIGWLERALVFLLVSVGAPAGVGFLITAKSILRIGEVKDGADRKLAEYIIIGTFLSFGWALFIAYLTQSVIALWAN